MPETPVSAIDQRNFWLVLACLKKTLRSIISKRSKYREALESRIKFEIKVLNKWEPDFRKSEWWQLQWDDWTFWLSDTAFTELFLGFDFLLLSFSRIHLHSSWHCFFWQEPHFLSPLLALESSSKRERREPFNGWDAVFPLWNVTDWRKKWGRFSMKNLKKMSDWLISFYSPVSPAFKVISLMSPLFIILFSFSASLYCFQSLIERGEVASKAFELRGLQGTIIPFKLTRIELEREKERWLSPWKSSSLRGETEVKSTWE